MAWARGIFIKYINEDASDRRRKRRKREWRRMPRIRKPKETSGLTKRPKRMPPVEAETTPGKDRATY